MDGKDEDEILQKLIIDMKLSVQTPAELKAAVHTSSSISGNENLDNFKAFRSILIEAWAELLAGLPNLSDKDNNFETQKEMYESLLEHTRSVIMKHTSITDPEQDSYGQHKEFVLAVLGLLKLFLEHQLPGDKTYSSETSKSSHPCLINLFGALLTMRPASPGLCSILYVLWYEIS